MIAGLLAMYLTWIAAVAIWAWFGSVAWRSVAKTARTGHELRAVEASAVRWPWQPTMTL